MKSYGAVLLAVCLGAGMAHADPMSISNLDPQGNVPSTAEDVGSYGGFGVGLLPAFGQVFQLDGTTEISDFTFYLTPVIEGRGSSAPKYVPFIMTWDASMGGAVGDPLFAGVRTTVSNDANTVSTSGLTLEQGQYVAFFSALDENGGSVYTGRSGYRGENAAVKGLPDDPGAQNFFGSMVVSDQSVAGTFQELVGSLQSVLDVDLLLSINGTVQASDPVTTPDGGFPEPASFLLWSVLACVGIAFGWWRRRRR